MDNILSESWFSKNDFTVEEAALLLVNEDPLDIERIDNLKHMNFEKWKAAMNYLSQMMMDIRRGKLQTTYLIVLNMNENGKVIGDEIGCDVNRHKPMAKNLTSIDLDSFYQWAIAYQISNVSFFQLRMPDEDKLMSAWDFISSFESSINDTAKSLCKLIRDNNIFLYEVDPAHGVHPYSSSRHKTAFEALGLVASGVAIAWRGCTQDPFFERVPSTLWYSDEGIKFAYERIRFDKYQIEQNLTMHSEYENTVSWSEFAGKETSLMFIAGLAIALEKSSPGFKHGCKMNKSAIANAAIKAINDYGIGTEINPKTLTNLINVALKNHVPNLNSPSQGESK
ncbi:hypothetical protein LPW36_04820 [Jinshanibacter sp. LJY008]|uniref:Uncharacterized protein n=1 Tax=Limnobaculum eriocheiris TaxID=2897391 RepID=A0A9X1MVL5_9GAMM|nr:hypothetical protein [Limnobaculum eriocheiris]MCD1125353.1 hypothetical protein [Limnobaculum eriocheiris]